MSDLAYGMQPVVHKPAALAVHGGADTPTAVMSDDVLSTQRLHFRASPCLQLSFLCFRDKFAAPSGNTGSGMSLI